MTTNRPFASKTLTPFGLAPNRSNLLPSFPTCSQETAVQVPASCSLSVFCWAVAAPGSMSANAGITERLKMCRRFIGILHHLFERFRRPLQAARECAGRGHNRPAQTRRLSIGYAHRWHRRGRLRESGDFGTSPFLRQHWNWRNLASIS